MLLRVDGKRLELTATDLDVTIIMPRAGFADESCTIFGLIFWEGLMERDEKINLREMVQKRCRDGSPRIVPGSEFRVLSSRLRQGFGAARLVSYDFCTVRRCLGS